MAGEPPSADARRRRARWWGRAAAVVLLAAASWGFLAVPWPVAGWYHAPAGEAGPAMSFLFWDGQVYEFPEDGGADFVGWYETEGDHITLTNRHGRRAHLGARGWGCTIRFLDTGDAGFAWREWRPKVWWELRQRPLPEPPPRRP